MPLSTNALQLEKVILSGNFDIITFQYTSREIFKYAVSLKKYVPKEKV